MKIRTLRRSTFAVDGLSHNWAKTIKKGRFAETLNQSLAAMRVLPPDRRADLNRSDSVFSLAGHFSPLLVLGFYLILSKLATTRKAFSVGLEKDPASMEPAKNVIHRTFSWPWILA